MKKYEIMYIVPSKYTEGEMDGIIKQVAGIMGSAGAQISDTHNLGKRRLTYPIANQRNGTYILVYFEAEAANILKMDQTLRMTSEVLRHMIVERDPHIKQIPTLIDTEDRHSDEQREHRPAAPIQAKPIAPAKQASVDINELDRKLDEILTEEVL